MPFMKAYKSDTLAKMNIIQLWIQGLWHLQVSVFVLPDVESIFCDGGQTERERIFVFEISVNLLVAFVFQYALKELFAFALF